MQSREQSRGSSVRWLERAVFALGVAAFVVSFAMGLYQSLRTSGRPPELRFDELGQARSLAGSGQREAAARQLKTYAIINGATAEGWLKLGLYLWQGLGDRKGAIEAYERALAVLPTPPEAHQALAVLYAQEGMVAEAHEQAVLATEAGLEVPQDVWRAIASGGGGSS